LIRIGVLADTHIRHLAAGAELAERLLAGPFRQVELVLHAGDVGLAEWLPLLAPKPVLAVRGNTDAADCGWPMRRQLHLGGVRIGLIHGWGAPQGLEQRVMTGFEPGSLDVLIYGHSHVACCCRQQGMLCLNPGSPCVSRSGGGTVALLRLEQGQASAEILPFDPKG